MPKFSRIVLTAIVCLLLPVGVYGFDFKLAHENAEGLDPARVEADAADDPQSAEKQYMAGIICLSDYRHDEAEVYFRKILAIDPLSVEGQWGLAECMRRRRNYEQCKNLLDPIIKNRPDFYPAYITGAYINYMQFNFERAADLSYRVVELGPERVDLSNYVRALGLYGGSKGMIAHYGGPLSKIINGRAVLPSFQKAYALKPDSVGSLFGLGAYYLLAPPLLGRDWAKAETYLLRALEADRRFVEVYVRLAQMYRVKGEEEKYEAYLSRALEIDPAHEMALDVLSRACRFICPDSD